MTKFNDFKKFALSKNVVSPMYFDKLAGRMLPKNDIVFDSKPEKKGNIDVFDELLESRTIFLGEGIDDFVANLINAQMLYLDSVGNSDDINMIINCPGGSVYDGLGIYDTMQYVKSDISTTVLGMAASMAAVILCAGAKGKRFSSPNSRIMIHQPSGGARGTAAEMEVEIKEMMVLKNGLYQIIADHTGQPVKKVGKDCEKDKWLSSKDALAYGLIDDIITKRV